MLTGYAATQTSPVCPRRLRPAAGWLRLTGSGIIGLAVALGALSGCSSPEGHRVANQRPQVRLTGGPVQGDSVSYSTEFFWRGWDPDGIIDHYQYAIDIPDHFSLDDINNPNPVGIAWHDTTAFRARFLFRTSTQDTILAPDGSVVLPERYRGNHTFYVRSIDNEGAVSDADYLSFTARTITPRTHFVVPRVIRDVQILQVGRQLSVKWEGVDPDSPDPRKQPAYYEWKLIPVDNILAVQVADFAVHHNGAPVPWRRVGGDTTSLMLSLNPPQDYVLAVRGVDEAGGTEDQFYWGQNAVRLASLNANRGTPELTVHEATLGTAGFPGEVTEMEVAAGACLRFDYTADADVYGGIIQGFNYGIDVADVDADGPASGFVGWSLIPYTVTPICFPRPGIHTITFKCRDTGGGVTIGTILVRAVPFAFDREVLYVDDYRLYHQGAVTDAMMDERALDMLRDAGATDIYQYDVSGPGDSNAEPQTLKLSQMGRYRLIVWSVFGSGYAGRTAALQMNACSRNRLLQAYVAAGGSVWFYGQQLFATFKSFSSDNCIATLEYSRTTGIDFQSPTFACDFLHICGGDIRDVQDNTKQDGMVRAVPTVEGARNGFAPIEIDSTVFNYAGIGGVPFVDAMLSPTYDEGGGLDSLYTVSTVRSNSVFNRKPCAFRYADPNPVPKQGPVAAFGFPYHLMKPGSAAAGTGIHGLARLMLDWFHAHQGAPPAERGRTPE